ncbi:MAG: imidazolonepropionase [Woeseiaceae bacterium]|nr:imidazolonepropionase [Woeseiaceae bacterium]
MERWDLLLTDARIAPMRATAEGYPTIDDGAIGIGGGTIAWIGARADLPPHEATETRRLAGRWVTPALIDCHTHLVFAGDRSGEFEARLCGASYADIAAAGGGILATVDATRAASVDELVAGARPRLAALAADGVATVEIKSGYGLDVAGEVRMLEAIRQLAAGSPLTIRPTLLALHALPVEFRENREAYLDLVCDELLPAVAESGLATAVDAFCESLAFTVPEVERVFARAQSLRLPVKLHADQLSASGGAELAARAGALSADHLEYATPAGIAALAAAGSVAVLLPGAYVTLGETRQPPVGLFREHGVPMAVASDLNPGTSPLCSLREAMALAARVFGLTPWECLAGTTCHAARALGLDHDRGSLEPGKRADLAVWDVEHPRELCYWLGRPLLAELRIGGREVSRG